jgi:hypothetical protein
VALDADRRYVIGGIDLPSIVDWEKVGNNAFDIPFVRGKKNCITDWRPDHQGNMPVQKDCTSEQVPGPVLLSPLKNPGTYVCHSDIKSSMRFRVVMSAKIMI